MIGIWKECGSSKTLLKLFSFRKSLLHTPVSRSSAGNTAMWNNTRNRFFQHKWRRVVVELINVEPHRPWIEKLDWSKSPQSIEYDEHPQATYWIDVDVWRSQKQSLSGQVGLNSPKVTSQFVDHNQSSLLLYVHCLTSWINASSQGV